MVQHRNCSDPDIVLGLANVSLLPPNGSRHNDHAKVVGEKGLKHAISEEEMEIRREIEREIERDLEEEIKGGIYQQALRLHRLYQHRKQGSTGTHANNKPPDQKSKELLEVNISIRVEGGTKMKIKETKKQAPESCRQRTSRSDNAARTLIGADRLDWVKSLRSSAAPAAVRKNVGCYRTKMPLPANDRCRCQIPNSFKRSLREG